MISRKNLKDLTEKRLKDASVLIKNRRYQGAIYLSGYSIELFLKYKICHIFQLSKGFPEFKPELNSYNNKIKKIFTQNVTIKDFKTHNLSQLLIYSGKELDVKTNALNEWSIISAWNPEIRYKNKIYSKKDTMLFIKSVQIVLSILKN